MDEDEELMELLPIIIMIHLKRTGQTERLKAFAASVVEEEERKKREREEEEEEAWSDGYSRDSQVSTPTSAPVSRKLSFTSPTLADSDSEDR